MKHLRSDAGSRGRRRFPDAARGDRQLRGVHEVSGAAAARHDRSGGAGRRADVQRDRMRGLPRARPRRPRRTRIRCSPASRCRSSRICCCTTSVLATTFRRRPRCRTRFARRRCGDSRPPSAPARRQRQHRRGRDRPPPRRGGRRPAPVRAAERRRSAASLVRVSQFALARLDVLDEQPSMRRARRSSSGAPPAWRRRTESAAASRASTSIACPGFSPLLSMKRRKAGS